MEPLDHIVMPLLQEAHNKDTIYLVESQKIPMIVLFDRH